MPASFHGEEMMSFRIWKLKSQYLEMQLSSGEDDVREIADIEGILSALLDTRKEVARGMRISRL